MEVPPRAPYRLGLRGGLSRVPLPREVGSEGRWRVLPRDTLEPRIEGRATSGSCGCQNRCPAPAEAQVHARFTDLC